MHSARAFSEQLVHSCHSEPHSGVWSDVELVRFGTLLVGLPLTPRDIQHLHRCSGAATGQATGQERRGREEESVGATGEALGPSRSSQPDIDVWRTWCFPERPRARNRRLRRIRWSGLALKILKFSLIGIVSSGSDDGGHVRGARRRHRGSAVDEQAAAHASPFVSPLPRPSVQEETYERVYGNRGIGEFQSKIGRAHV